MLLFVLNDMKSLIDCCKKNVDMLCSISGIDFCQRFISKVCYIFFLVIEQQILEFVVLKEINRFAYSLYHFFAIVFQKNKELNCSTSFI